MSGFTSKDAALIVSAKPSGTTATTAASNAINLGAIDVVGVRSEPFELVVDAPAFTANELPSDATLTIKLQSCADESFASGVTDAFAVTIGDGTAAAAATYKFRPTLKGDQFWRVAILTTLSGSGAVADTAQAKAVTLSYVC